MTRPVSSTFYPAYPPTQPAHDKEDTKESKKSSLQSEFDTLIKEYTDLLQIPESSKGNSPTPLEAAYEKLSKFTAAHPEFKEQLPGPEQHISKGTVRGYAAGLNLIGADTGGIEHCPVQ